MSREAARCWVIKFGPLIAANLPKRRQPPSPRWHLDEMVVKIGGRRMFLWRAVDDEGEVLDVLVQKRRNKAAALKLLRELLKPKESIRRRSSPISSHPTARRRASWDSRVATDPAACARTTAPRIRTWRFDDENENSRNSNRRVQLKDFSQPTPRSTTPSTFTAPDPPSHPSPISGCSSSRGLTAGERSSFHVRRT